MSDFIESSYNNKLRNFYFEPRFSINYKIATIKHAHHDFEIDKEDTDSYLHRKAGAKEVIISSSKRWAKIVELYGSKEKQLDQLISQFENIEIVIVEGFSKVC